MYYCKIIYRQKQPHGVDVPLAECECTKNGPFTTRESAERYAATVASQTPVLQTEIVEGA